MRYLEAIETDDYKRLPGGIFNRSFIRAYAKFIGYDEHQAIEDYARTLRERGESDDESSTKPHHSLVYTDDGNAHKRSPIVTLLLAILILALLSAAVYVGLYFYNRSAGNRRTGNRQPGNESSRAVAYSPAPETGRRAVKEVKNAFTV
jgi:cytoskeletal protein RodZ